MIASDKQIAILSNWGNDDDVTVSFRGSVGRIVNILLGVAVKTTFEDNNTLATFRLPKESVVVLLAQ
jgi:hypothetical protein